MQIQSLGQEDPLEEGMAAHSSVVAWRIPWTEEPGGLWSIGSQRVRHTGGSPPLPLSEKRVSLQFQLIIPGCDSV